MSALGFWRSLVFVLGTKTKLQAFGRRKVFCVVLRFVPNAHVETRGGI